MYHLLLERKLNHLITVLFVIIYSTVYIYPILISSVFWLMRIKYLLEIKENLQSVKDKLNRNT